MSAACVPCRAEFAGAERTHSTGAIIAIKKTAVALQQEWIRGAQRRIVRLKRTVACIRAARGSRFATGCSADRFLVLLFDVGAQARFARDVALIVNDVGRGC